jgi:hypothetical protein
VEPSSDYRFWIVCVKGMSVKNCRIIGKAAAQGFVIKSAEWLNPSSRYLFCL